MPWLRTTLALAAVVVCGPLGEFTTAAGEEAAKQPPRPAWAVKPRPRLSETERKALQSQRDGVLQQIAELTGAKKLDDAVPLVETVIAVDRRLHGRVSLRVVSSMGVLARFHEQNRQDFPAAAAVRRQLLDLHEKLYGATHWKTTDARLALNHTVLLQSLKKAQRDELRRAGQLNSRRTGLYQQGKYRAALKPADEALEIFKKTLGEDSPQYAASLHTMAWLYEKMQNYAQAEPLYLRAIAIRKKTLGERHPETAWSLNNLGNVYTNTGKYAKSEPLQLQAMRIRKQVLGEHHADYATSLHTTGWLYQKMGRYAKAEPLYLQALKIRSNVLDENDLETAWTLNNLANIYIRTRKYAKAERLHRQALKIRKEVLGENHADYASSLYNLGWLHLEKGEYAKAEPFYQQALKIRKEVLGENHVVYAATLHDMALVYQRMKEYAKAEPLYLQVLTIRKKVLGEKHLDYAWTLNNLANVYTATGKYAKAEPLHRQALRIRREVVGENHPDYARSVHNLAWFYHRQGEYAKAEPLYLQALEIRKNALGENHPDYLQSLHNRALLYQNKGDYAKAEPLYLHVLQLRRKVLGERHVDYAWTLNNLANVYKDTGLYAKAEPLYRQVLTIRKELLGESHPDYLATLNHMAFVYRCMGKYAKAELLYKEALQTRKKLADEKPVDFAWCVGNLASLYQSMGEFAKAEPLYKQALQIRKKAQGEKHPDYGKSLEELAGLYKSLGEYARAEPLYRQALEIRKQVLGESHPDYAQSLYSLATFYTYLSDYAKAEQLYRQAAEIQKKALGKNSYNYAFTLTALAGVYDSMGQSARAESLYREASEAFKKSMGEKHLTYASSLSRLATFHWLMGKYEQAEYYCRQAAEIRKQAVGEKHEDYASSLIDLARLNESMRKYLKAEPLYRQALTILKNKSRAQPYRYGYCLIRLAGLYQAMGKHSQAEPLYRLTVETDKQVFGPNHSSCAGSLSILGNYYESIGKHANAEPLYRQALEITFQNLRSTFAVLSERQQLRLVESLRRRIDYYLSNTGKVDVPADRVYRYLLAWKGMVSVEQSSQRLHTTDPGVRKLLNEYRLVGQQLASLVFTRPTQSQRKTLEKQIQRLTDRKESLQRALALKSAPFRADQERQQLTPQKLVGVLPKDAALVDVLEYWHRSPRSTKTRLFTRQRRLVAFIVRPGHPVLRVDLGSAATLERQISLWQATHGTGPVGESAGRELRKHVWLPLSKHLKDVKTVLFSPDGVLTRLPLGALPGSKPGTYLLHDYAIATVPVPQMLPELLQEKSSTKQSPSLLLVGGVDFGVSPGQLQVASNDRSLSLVRSAPRQGRRLFGYLKGTLAEAESIRGLHIKRFPKAKRTTLSRQAATEAAFRTAAETYRYLHVATHGFFAPPSIQTASSTQPNRPFSEDSKIIGYHPGLLSGIALAGANKGAAPTDDFTKVGDDGILTALEVAALDLHNVELVVLSACETGLGKVAGGEGVLGLQRAFQVAGAKSTVTTLWKVDDAATQALMTEFYRNLWEHKLSRIEALRQAQLAMLTRWDPAKSRLQPRGFKITGKPSGRQPGDPFFWAAFQLSGDWR